MEIGGGLGGAMPGQWVRSRTPEDAALLDAQRNERAGRGGYQTWTRKQRRRFRIVAAVVVIVVTLVALGVTWIG